MEKKKSVLTIILAVFVLISITVIYWIAPFEKKLGEAEDYGQLQLMVKFGGSREYIKIWQSDEGDYYFFLPANVSLRKSKIANLGEHTSLWLDDVLYDPADKDALQCDHVYTMRMRRDNGDLDSVKLQFVQSQNLPALFINTESGSVEQIHADKSVHEAAALYLYDEKGDQAFGGNIEYIKCRGTSSFSQMEKKSYQIRFHNKESLFGMNSAEKWILLANAKDGSFLRNKIVYDFAEKYSDVEGLGGQHVDLYLNGQYAGNYYLCEKPEVGSGRLEIQDLDKLNKTVNSKGAIESAVPYVSEDGTVKAFAGLSVPEDISGGYLVVSVNSDNYNACECGFITSMGHSYKIVSPEKASLEEVLYIQNQFNEFESALEQEDGINPETGKHISEYMDLEIWAQKFLIEEGFQNPDSAFSSMYFYKDSDARDPLIKSGPVWDYDRAFGSYLTKYFTNMDDPEQLSYYCVYSKDMLKHEEVRSIVSRLLEEWFIPYVEENMAADIARESEYLRGSAYCDAIRWSDRGDYYVSYEANCEYLVEFMKTRVKFLNGIFNGVQYHTVTFLAADKGADVVYRVPHGGYMELPAPIGTSYEEIFVGWVNKSTGIGYDARLPVLEDTVYEGRWISAELLMQNVLSNAGLSLEDVDIDTLQSIVDALRKMQEEQSDD